MRAYRLKIVWTIAALCILFYLLSHIGHWQALDAARLDWREGGRAAAFRTAAFWRFAPVATLLHTGPVHLAMNLWCLLTLGLFVERRDGPVPVLLLWLGSAWIAMGVETLAGGVGRIGLSGFTYALLGAAIVRWREAVSSPRRVWTGAAMLAFLIAGAPEAAGLPPIVPEIAHVAHATGLMLGMLLAVVTARVGRIAPAGGA